MQGTIYGVAKILGTICMVRMNEVLQNGGTDSCRPVQQSPKSLARPYIRWCLLVGIFRKRVEYAC